MPAELAPPFLSPRVAVRAREVLAYAGITGVAFLISQRGEVGLRVGDLSVADIEPVAAIIRAHDWKHAREEVVSFAYPGYAGIHAAYVSAGWILCVASTFCAPAAIIAERVGRARDVLALGLASDRAPLGGAGGDGGGPLPAEVTASAGRRPRSA